MVATRRICLGSALCGELLDVSTIEDAHAGRRACRLQFAARFHQSHGRRGDAEDTRRFSGEAGNGSHAPA